MKPNRPQRDPRSRRPARPDRPATPRSTPPNGPRNGPATGEAPQPPSPPAQAPRAPRPPAPPKRPPAPPRDAPAFPRGLGPLDPPATFVAEARALGVQFDPGDLERLGTYLAHLLEASKTHNLTAVDDPQEAWTRHLLDSLTLIPLLAELPDGAKVIDVGSGGGLPGIPLAACMPQLRFTLLEATGKKAEFLRHVVSVLDLKNVEVVQERAERAGQEHRAHREKYGAAIARAVGPLNVLAELTVPFVRAPEPGREEEGGGRALLIKGAKADEELAAAKQALHLLHAAHSGTIETPTGRIVVLEKLRKTPRQYPRPDGEPKRSPLA